MKTETDIYLTPEIANYAKNNSTSNLDSLAAFSFRQIIALVVVSLILAGIFYFTQKVLAAANVGTQNESKKMLQKIAGVFILLVIVLAVYSSQGALTFDFSLKPLATLYQGEAVETKAEPFENDGGGVAIVSGDEASMFQAIQANESSARSALSARKITVNNSPCQKIRAASCTSIGGLGSKTIDLLSQLSSACKCTLVVTGGTEWWLHGKTTKHKPGNASAVDLRKNPSLDAFIYNSPEFKRGTPWNICVSLFTWNGYIFCDESSKNAQSGHWHIQPI